MPHASFGLKIAARLRAVRVTDNPVTALAVEPPWNLLKVLTGLAPALLRHGVVLAETSFLLTTGVPIDILGTHRRKAIGRGIMSTTALGIAVR